MNLIAAVDQNWAIGNKNELLVRIPADQKFFRETTTGKVVVMGRKTLESFPNGLPLKNRTNIVLTHDHTYKVLGAVVVHDMDELHEELKKYDSQDIYVENTYDTSLMEAFRIPSGTAVELYATTLHYAPCNASDGGFLVAVVLPKGTNEALEHPHTGGEDALLAAKNKWLIGHPEGGLPEGSYIGLTGENLEIK